MTNNSKTPSAHLLLDSLRPNGSLVVSQHALFSRQLTLELTPRRRDLERSSWNCVRKTRLWSDVYVLLNLVHLLKSSRNSTLSRNCFPSSDSYLRMIRILAVFFASSPSFLWLNTSARKRTEFTLLVHFSTLVRINPGKCVCVLPETSPSSLTPSARTSLTTISSRPLTCFSMTTSLR